MSEEQLPLMLGDCAAPTNGAGLPCDEQRDAQRWPCPCGDVSYRLPLPAYYRHCHQCGAPFPAELPRG